MANNPYVNKVEFGDQTLMDITDTTATANDVVSGKVFYAASGARSVGSASIPENTSDLTNDGDGTSPFVTEDGADDTYVKKIGDTMTGGLDIVDDQVPSSTPSSDIYGQKGLQLLDSNGNRVTYLLGEFLSNGYRGLNLGTVRNVNGNDVYNSINLDIDGSGNPQVYVSNATAWRTALNAVNKDGDTITGTVFLKDDSFPTEEIPSADKYHSASIRWVDPSWNIIGHLTTAFFANGRRGFEMGTRRTINGSTAYNTLRIYIDDNNAQGIELNKTAWQKALTITGINLQNNSQIFDNATNIHFYTNTAYSGNQYADWAMGYNGRFAVRIRTRASASDAWSWGAWQYLDTWTDITPTAGTHVGALGSTMARYNPLTKLCCLNINIRIDGASLTNSENLLTGLPKPVAAMQTSIAATTNDVVRVKFTTAGNMQVDGAKTISTTKQYYNGYITYPYSSLT